MSRLGATAQGKVGELLFAALAMVGSSGVIKAGFPMVDDEGRDVSLHIGGKFRKALAIQVKTTRVLKLAGRQLRIVVAFSISPENMIDSPLYWYVFAYLDTKRAALDQYLFVVPSKVVHAHVSAHWYRGKPLFVFQGSMDPKANDRWTPYRLRPTELGRHLVSIMRSRPKSIADEVAVAGLGKIPGACFFGTEPEAPLHPRRPPFAADSVPEDERADMPTA